jgi:RNA polymerase sigma-70 factor (ECF subfamily)
MTANEPSLAETKRPPAAGEAVRREWILAAVDQYEAPLVLYAARLLKDMDLARDAVQETFVRLCHQNEAEIGGHLGEWLFHVCRTRALDFRRKEKRMPPLSAVQSSPPAATVTPAEAFESKEAAASVLRLLDDLPENQQEVIRLKFQHGMSYKEISRVTSLSVGNVGFLMHTGLKTLRAQAAPQ